MIGILHIAVLQMYGATFLPNVVDTGLNLIKLFQKLKGILLLGHSVDSMLRDAVSISLIIR